MRPAKNNTKVTNSRVKPKSPTYGNSTTQKSGSP